MCHKTAMALTWFMAQVMMLFSKYACWSRSVEPQVDWTLGSNFVAFKWNILVSIIYSWQVLPIGHYVEGEDRVWRGQRGNIEKVRIGRRNLWEREGEGWCWNYVIEKQTKKAKKIGLRIQRQPLSFVDSSLLVGPPLPHSYLPSSISISISNINIIILTGLSLVSFTLFNTLLHVLLELSPS